MMETLCKIYSEYHFLYYLTAIFFGMLVSFPVGPLGLLCVQRTIKKSRKDGYVSGVGAASSDQIYGLLVVFSLAHIHNFIDNNLLYIYGFLAIFFMLVGFKLYSTKESSEIQDEFVHPSISAFFMGISNPMTAFVFLGIFSFFNKVVPEDEFSLTFKLILLLFIFIGANLFWMIITKIIVHYKKRFSLNSFSMVDKIIGIVIFLFGIQQLYNFIKYLLK